MKHIIDKYYNKCKQSKSIVNDFGFITFAKCFRYLSLWISNELDNRYAIESQIKKTNQAIGALKILNFSSSKYSDKISHIYFFGVVNLGF